MAQDLSTFVPEIWSKAVVSAAESKVVMASRVVRDFDGEISTMGNVVNVPTIGDLTVGDKAAGTDVSFEELTSGTVAIDIDKHKYFAFQISDIDSVQANQSLIERYASKGGHGIAKQIDEDLLGLHSELSQTVGTAGTDLDKDTILAAIELLDEADAPTEDRYLVITPAQKKALLGIADFVQADRIGDPSTYRTGELGTIFGVTVLVSNLVPVVSGSPDATHNLMFQKEAFALAMQQEPRVQANNNIRALSTDVVGDVLYGVAVLNDELAVDVLS